MAVDQVQIVRAAAALWGLKLGFPTTQSVLAQSNADGGNLGNFIDARFNASFGQTANATLITQVVANLGLSRNAAIDAAIYLAEALAMVPTTQRGSTIADSVTLFSGLASDPVFGPAASAFNAAVAVAVVYGASPANLLEVVRVSPSAATVFSVTLGQDRLVGTEGDDTFFALDFGQINSLQPFDSIDGGAGFDTLFAEMYRSVDRFGSSDWQVPFLANIENLVIRARSDPTTSRDPVTLFPHGAQRVESRDSGKDLLIMGASVKDDQNTSHFDIAFVQSEAGDVDLGVYFQGESLVVDRRQSQLNLEIVETRSVAQGLDPLVGIFVDGLTFRLDGELIYLKDEFYDGDIQAATTYAQLVAALQTALALVPAASGVTVSLGAPFTVLDVFGTPVSGTRIVLTAPGNLFEIGSFVISVATVPPQNMHTAQFITGSPTDKPVTSALLLDGVGRGDNGGSVVVGTSSNSQSTIKKGVDRFDISIDRSSKLATINSNDNWLKEVVLKNIGVAGDLQLLGRDHSPGNFGPVNAQEVALPSAQAQHNHWGFSDVRLIDASAMTGSVSLDAEVTMSALAKYVLRTEAQNFPALDDSGKPLHATESTEFVYSGGSGDDLIHLQVEGGISASSGHIGPGVADFRFCIIGNAGDDQIILRLADPSVDGLLAGPGSASHPLYLQQQGLKNVSIDAGPGNDTVRTPGVGDSTLLLGDGDDVAFLDNSGQSAIWVLGTVDQLSASQAAARDLGALLPDATNNHYGNNPFLPGFESLYRATVTLSYKGLGAATQLPAGLYRPSDTDINQAIQSLIADDARLSKLLETQDGPGQVLILKSLIDGQQLAGDLSVSLKAWTVPSVLAGDAQAAYAALNPEDATPTPAELQALLDDGLAQFNSKGDFVAQLASIAGVPITGAASITPSDNTVIGGAGNDLIVMGSTSAAGKNESSNDTAVFADAFGNDTIVGFRPGALANGGDLLDLRALGALGALDAFPGTMNERFVSSAQAPGIGTVLFAAPATDGMLRIHLQTPQTDSAAEIQALYLDSGEANTAAKTSVYIAVLPASNRALVYTVLDPVGNNNVTATLAGSIDLADTPWLSLRVENFS